MSNGSECIYSSKETVDSWFLRAGVSPSELKATENKGGNKMEPRDYNDIKVGMENPMSKKNEFIVYAIQLSSAFLEDRETKDKMKVIAILAIACDIELTSSELEYIITNRGENK